jgi:hypothetical protein
MALISAFTVIKAVSLLHITLAYYFLVNPGLIADQNFVWLLGNAMDMVLIHFYSLKRQCANILSSHT